MNNMFRNKFWRYLTLSISVSFFYTCTQPDNNESGQQMDASIGRDSIPLPAKIQDIGDGNISIFYIDSASEIRDSIVKNNKELRISGDVFLKITGEEFPISIYTSLMKLKVLKPSAFRITAYDKDQGQSVESLHGEIKISKNYASPFPEPDTLRNDNLYMVNCSIDLSEKENLDDDKLAKWWERVNKIESKN